MNRGSLLDSGLWFNWWLAPFALGWVLAQGSLVNIGLVIRFRGSHYSAMGWVQIEWLAGHVLGFSDFLWLALRFWVWSDLVARLFMYWVSVVTLARPWYLGYSFLCGSPSEFWV